MTTYRLTMGIALLGLAASALWAQAAPVKVMVSDHGPTRYVAGPTAPAHVVGLVRLTHDITLNTGRVAYGLRYVVSEDPKDPTIAIPGEGYIGMPQPMDGNWYGGGFFDLKLNGQSIGTRMVEVFAGRATGDRGYVDYVFDTPQAVVRVRFVGLAGGDCLYAQVLLDPRTEIQQVSLSLRCYPSGFVSGQTKHALSAARDLPVGSRASLDLNQEWWLNYYDSSRGNGGADEGSCSVLWVPGQTQEASVTVGAYGTETALQLKPTGRDFRFVFFDHTGRRNDEVQADLKARATGLLQELSGLTFTDSAVLNWSLADKQAQTRELLAALPADKELAARYERWGRELEEQLKQVQESGKILAEARALATIAAWDRSLPDLRLQALLSTF